MNAEGIGVKPTTVGQDSVEPNSIRAVRQLESPKTSVLRKLCAGALLAEQVVRGSSFSNIKKPQRKRVNPVFITLGTVVVI